MGGGFALLLSDDERRSLEGLERAGSTPQDLADRARIILALGAGGSLAAIARDLKTWPQRVARWRNRWLGTEPGRPVAERLEDGPRSGAPATFTAEQGCAIIALACERPEACDVPITHWSTAELARAAAERGIVASISPRSVGRLLKRCGPQAAPVPAVADGETGSGVRRQMRRHQ
ncbi:MAG: helix-turn-helix domain-containing protein [Candidatus Competibacteraceae bacterium]|nr:helix-turn-helix domain-containing protein [Candidatus Competibacteraceae bacterium]